MRSQISIGTLFFSSLLNPSLTRFLAEDRYVVTHISSATEFANFVEQQKQHLDCLIVEYNPEIQPVLLNLSEKAILLPSIIIQTNIDNNNSHAIKTSEIAQKTDLESNKQPYFYHCAEVQISIAQLEQIDAYIEKAISQFLTMSPTPQLQSQNMQLIAPNKDEINIHNLLRHKQRRLTEKLRERLGYLGVYYKRNPQQFLRNLPLAEQQEFLETLKAAYHEIVLNYFSPKSPLNQKIDEFVTLVFFADVAVTQIVEIHMELMDEFAKQLKLEGRSEEILLDYRLTLIDTLAHLCEMYRRSIPRDV